MPARTRKRSKPASTGPLTAGQVDDLIAACQADLPEIGEEVAPSDPEAPRRLPPPAGFDLRATIRQEARRSRVEHDAKNLKDETAACYLYGSLSPLIGGQIDAGAYRAYIDGLLREAGNPTDPLERMMVEQLALAHHNIGRLHVKAASCRSVQEASAYNAAAARLMAEFRRSALALKTYRAPAGAPAHLTVVKQQNVAVGEQQVALVEGPGERQAGMPQLPSNAEQRGAPALLEHVHQEEPEC